MGRIDLSSAEPLQIYATVAEMDEQEFEQLMQRPAERKLVIDALIAHMVGIFRPEAAGGVAVIIHIKLWDRPGGGYEHFELQIAEGRCEMLEELPGSDPDLTLKVRPTDLRRLITGETGVRRLALTGRLRAIGDLSLGMKMPELFDF